MAFIEPPIGLILLGVFLCGGQAFESPANFVPQVAFQCGYSNRFLSRSGKWHTDENPDAVCLRGKMDVLKYCQKMYPLYNVTNMAELYDLTEIENWCSTDANAIQNDCKSKFAVRPYECIVSRLENHGIDIPDGCSFDHSEDRTACQDYKFWTRKSRETCAKTFTSVKKIGVVKFIKVLEPCGLDLFSAHEYLCCPEPAENGDKMIENKKSVSTQRMVKFEDEDGDNDSIDGKDEAENVEDAFDEDSSSIIIDASKFKSKNGSHHSENDAWSRKNINLTVDLTKKPEMDDYYRSANLHNEHTRYQQAVVRLEQRHKRLVTMIMQEWDRLEKKYNSMANKLSKRGKKFRKEMILHYQSSIAKIEDETKREREKLSTVHEKRILADFHAHYRSVDKRLATSIDHRHHFSNEKASKAEILTSAHALIRLAEKYRQHAIGQYRHVLEADPVGASTNHRAALIDLLIRIDQNLARSLNQLDVLVEDKTAKKIKPSVLDFWQNYREDLSPDISNKSVLAVGDSDNIEKLIKFCEENWHSTQATEKITMSNDITITATSPALTTNKILDAMVLKDRMHHSIIIQETSVNAKNAQGLYFGYWIYFVSGTMVLIMCIAVVLTIRRNHQNRLRGFVKVDACTPEERHVAKMQVNGYQNPTYKYFDQT